MESENTMMENENFWMIPDSESYSVGSYTEKGGASVSKVHLTQIDKTEKPRIKRYVIDSDSDSSEMDSDSERRELASAAVMCFMDTKTFHRSTAGNNFPKDSWSERRTVNSDSENPVMSSDSVKHMKKAETCKSTCNLGRLKVARRSESLQHWLDAKRKELDSDYGGHLDSSGKYHCKSIVPSFGKSQHDLQTFQSITEEDQVGASSEKHQTQPGNERDRNEPESKRHLIKTEKRLDNKEFQMDREREGYLVESDRHDSENEAHLLEAHRLGARRKDNRPPGFWRPVTLPPKLEHEKKTEEQKSVQQKDSRVCRIQCRKYRSEDKTVRSKETSNLSYKQVSREKLKERHTYSSLTDEKIHRKASQKVSVYKRHSKEYGYTHSCESFRYQVTPNPLSSETCISNISSLVDSPTCESPKSVTRQKARRSITFSLDVGTQQCTRCFMEIGTSSFHKCPMNSDDSDSDSSFHGQSSSHCKYSLSSKTVRHYKTSRNRPLSQSLDPKYHVGIRCSLHREDSKCSMDSSSYLHCESCSALQKHRGSSSTHTISTDTKKIRDQGHIMSTPVRLSQSESKFNLTTQLQNKDNPEDSNIKFISAKSVKAKANILVSKDDTDHEDETTTEDETEVEYETDTEDEDDTKDKKDPKDKSDPDGSSYPEGGNSENNTDSNNGSNPSGASGPTGGPDSSNDGDSKNITDNNKSDPAVENATNSDINLKYSTDEICTNNLDNASDQEEYFNQCNDANFKADTNQTCASGNENRTVMDCVSGCNNDTDPKNATGQERYNVHSEIIRSLSNNPDFIKNENAPSINPSSQNSHGPLKDLDSNSISKPSSATSHDVVSTNNIADPYYGTKPTSTAIYKYTAMLNYYSDLNDVIVFKYKVSSSFIVNSKYFDRKKYAMRPNITPSTVNAVNTSKITSCTSAITAGKNYATDTKHFPRFSHINSFNIIINANNSTSTSDINNAPVTELEINSTSSVLKIVYGSISNFVFGTNYTYPDFLITSKFYDPLELSRAYTIFDNQNIGAQFQYSAVYMDSHNCKYATGSIDAIDAKESGFVKDFSRVQNPIGIKGPSPFKILSYQNVPLPSIDVIVEAELPDILKFALSSGAMKQSFELSLKTVSRQNVGH
ncbi:uncharacterized protein DDB_G0287625-like [Acomys russatus]|uniref:uncharacterized protein DDB_G0287625-like n=1 Tax=Acomys russatus TaxID=60746 RepID=UPI0021E2C477|nr:uncharacterized protein DDB_G0287625-like [Acomys russatus]